MLPRVALLIVIAIQTPVFSQCETVGSDFVCDFPVLEDQSVIGYCCHAWALRGVDGNAEFCFQHEAVPPCATDPNDLAEPYDPTDPGHLRSICETPFALVPHSTDSLLASPLQLTCLVDCPGPLPADPNMPPDPCTLSVTEVDPLLWPVVVYKVCPALPQGSGNSPCRVWWVPGTLECTDPSECDFQ